MKRILKIQFLTVFVALAVLGLAILPALMGSVEGKQMPGTIVIKYLKNKYNPVTFNHEMHTAIAGNCGTCHHQHDDKARATCKECHSLSPAAFKSSLKQSFGACSSCHSDYSPEMPELPGLKTAFHKKCFQCHVGIGDLGLSPGACAKTCHTPVQESKK